MVIIFIRDNSLKTKYTNDDLLGKCIYPSLKSFYEVLF